MGNKSSHFIHVVPTIAVSFTFGLLFDRPEQGLRAREASISVRESGACLRGLQGPLDAALDSAAPVGATPGGQQLVPALVFPLSLLSLLQLPLLLLQGLQSLASRGLGLPCTPHRRHGQIQL